VRSNAAPAHSSASSARPIYYIARNSAYNLRIWLIRVGERHRNMRIFVSSSFEDLSEHRAAVIRVLRQLGHEVLAMEDLTAASAAPLSKVLDMVDRSEAYVGIFAWRHGYSARV
jgi:hypothetical protein